jgi:hypothetical protein
MEEILEENDRLKKEVDYLTETLQEVLDGFSRSVDFWRQRYFDLLQESLRDSLGATQRSTEVAE